MRGKPAVMILLAAAVLRLPLAADSGGKTEMSSSGRVIYNLDYSAFFIGTFGPLEPATLDKYVESLAKTGVTDLYINVNAQRTNYRSEVWESDWDGYDPNLGDDQPFFAGIAPERRFETGWVTSVYAFHKMGCDYPKRMIDSARQNHVKPWISIRMNDSHYPDRPDHPYHSTFWRAHPEWHLSGGPNPASAKDGWAIHGLDYEQPEVCEHYMKLVREVCSRYDLDGLELDYLRFWLYFRPGREHEGARLMTAFMQEVREATGAAAKRLGHPVELAVRVPSTPWIARRRGLDAVAWARAGFVDLVIAASAWPSTNSDVPIETWKGLLIGTDVTVALHLEDGIDSGAGGRRTMTHGEMRGVLTSGWHRGADAVYFFNLFAGPYQSWPREDHDRLLQDAGSYKALCAGTRLHPLTITSPWSEGEPGRERQLPYEGRHGVFRLHIGPKPLADQQARVELVIPECDQPLTVRLNGTLCAIAGKASGSAAPASDRHVYEVPPDALGDGYNLIEVAAEQDITITWVEISVRRAIPGTGH